MAPIGKRTIAKVIYWNVVAVVLIVGLFAVSITRRLHVFDSLIVRVSREHGVDPRLVSAVIWRESKFDPNQVGAAGEIGLMQVTEAAGQEWAEAAQYPLFVKRDLFEPEVNISAGTWYLARAIERWSKFDDPLPYALAEYNAGQRNARDFWESIGYPGTKQYVRDVLLRYRGHV